MRKLFLVGVALASIAVVGCSDDPVAPRPTLLLVANGDFEAGDLTGWTDSVVTTGTGGVYVLGDTLGPASGHVIPLPTEGANAALFDQNSSTTHILYQDITIPADYSAAFTASIYLNSEGVAYAVAPTEGLSVSGAETNQHFRIDVMDPAAAVDDVGTGVLQNLYLTMPADTTTANVVVTADLGAFAGETVRLRFAAAVRENFFQIGIDAVQVTAK